MNRRPSRYLTALFLSALSGLMTVLGCTPAGSPQQPAVRAFLPLEQMTVTGELRERIDLVQKRLLSEHPFSDNLVLEDIARTPGYQRRFEQFEGDISGRWIGALSVLSRLTGEQWDKHERIVRKTLALQQAGGWFGEDHRDNPWDGSNSPHSWGPQVFGHGRLLLGLVEYYAATSDATVLRAATRLAEYLMETQQLWQPEHRDHPWWGNFSSTLEAVMALHAVTGEEALLTLARHIAETMPDFGRYHSHTYLSTLIGLLHLYRATGDTQYLERVQRDYWEHILPVSGAIDGAMPEWFPDGMRTEGCSLVDWFKLNLELWRISGRGVYLDTAETVLLNGLYYHQCYSGFFGHTTRTPDFRGYGPEFDQAWWCCTMHGAQALGIAAGAIYAWQDECLFVNLFTPSSAAVTMGDRVIKINQETRYPQSGRITVTVSAESDGVCTLAFRIPAWSRLESLAVDHHAAAGQIKDGYARILLQGPGPFVVEVDLDLPFRIVTDGGADLWTRSYQPHANTAVSGTGALYFGPLLLVQDGFYNAVADVPLSVERVTPDGQFTLRPANPDGRTCRLPDTHVFLIPDNGKDPITLSPLSEATWHQSYRNDMPGFEQNKGMPVTLWPVLLQQQWTMIPAEP